MLLLAVLGLAGSAAAKTYVPKRTSWGDPDLRGTWPLNHLAFLLLQRPAQFGQREFLTDEEYPPAPDPDRQGGRRRRGRRQGRPPGRRILHRAHRRGPPHLDAGGSAQTAAFRP
ncbi:MAG: hypothetical protein WDN45_05755 [Caulobacteraceae bacterium]